MSDFTASWAPANAPAVTEHFNEAAMGSKQEVSSQTETTQGDSGLQKMLEEQRATPEAEMHLRPKDSQLVQEVHMDVEAEKTAFMNRMNHSGDFTPKL